jgi:S-adenosylmethionine uptake transporter
MASTAQSSPASAAFTAAVVGIALFSCMDAVMKGLSIGIGAYNAVFWRNLIGVVLSGILYAGARCPWPEAATLRLHLVRGAVSSVMAITFFWGLARVPMAEAISLAFIAPLVALYLAAALLGEPVGRRAILASLIGFSGVLVIVVMRGGNGGQSDLAGAAAILVSAMLYAYNIILMRQQALVAGPVEIAFFQSVIVAACLSVAAPFLAVVPGPEHLPALTLSAFLAIASLLLLGWAYARAEAQHLAPVEYTSLIWAAMLGYLVFGEEVGAATVVGAALIVTGCVIAARSGRIQTSTAEAAL